MPARIVASEAQRTFFEKLTSISLVLGAKPSSDAWSVNLHGKFVLYDKDWSSKTDKDPRETLLAIRDPNGAVPTTSSGEPLAHLHVVWTKVRWAKLELQELPLIGTDRAIGFYAHRDQPRTFAFYCTSSDVDAVLLLDEWVDINPK